MLKVGMMRADVLLLDRNAKAGVKTRDLITHVPWTIQM
jgi:hypothetical protein